MKRILLSWLLVCTIVVSQVIPAAAAATTANPATPAASAADASATADTTAPFNIITSPLPINLAGKPGSTLTADIRIKNGGTQTEKLVVNLMKFSAYGEEGKPAIADRAPGDDYFDWVSFSPKTFDAAPDVWITVKMTIKLPQSAVFGYYYAPVFSRASKTAPVAGKENALVGSAAVLVLVEAQVPGAKRTANIADFSVGKRTYEFLPASFSVKIHNGGNIHLVPKGNIFITRGSKTIATLDVKPTQSNVLPNSNRIFTASWNDGFPAYVPKQEGGKVVLDKNDKPVSSLQWDFAKASKLRFGHYTAHVLMAYDDGQRDVPLEATASFWVIPWRILGGLLVVLLLVGTGVWSVSRNILKKVRAPKPPKPVKK